MSTKLALIVAMFALGCADSRTDSKQHPTDFAWTNPTSPFPAVCGNGILEAGEECDDGNLILDDACCECWWNHVCGNGVVEPGEACDDGDGEDGGACSADCMDEGRGDSDGGVPPPPPPAPDAGVPTDLGCSLTWGYWKTHPEAWTVSSLTLGSVSYSASEIASIFAEPVAMNGLVSLAHQLLAVKLNLAAGADGSSVASAIADADAMIGALVVPPVGSGTLSPATTSALVERLSAFNEGNGGIPHCDD